MDLSLVEIWATMGIVAKGVVVVLVAMSLASTAVAVETVLRLGRADRESGGFLSAWRPALRAHGVEPAATEAERFPRSYAAHLVREASRATRDADREGSLEAFDRTVRRVVVAIGVDARRGLGVLATVGSTAPFIGLFGTVVGIVTAFHSIGTSGQGGLGSVSRGIAEALVSTALGIVVAIPALWLFNYLTQRIQRIVAELECIGLELSVAVLDEGREGERWEPAAAPVRREA